MIKLLTEKKSSALLVAAVILTYYGFVVGDNNMGTISKLILLLVEGLLLNYLCFRFGILGMRTNLPLVIFCTLGVLVVPQISLGDLIYGAVFLGAFFLAFESSEHQELSGAYMIYFGVLLGVAQSVNAISILLMPPVFVLFMQAGRRRPRHFILSVIYFLMVSAAYAGLLFVMELEHKIVQLIPVLTFDYSVFNSILFKLTVPFIVGSLIVHFLSLGRYSFRYPNKSKIVNYTMLFQLILSVFLVLLTAELDILVYTIMAASVLLSFAFGYGQQNFFVNASFVAIICICLVSLYFFEILILSH